MNISSIHSFDPSGQLLCRSYVAVLFNPISVQFSPMDAASGAQPEPMLWAIGVLTDGLPDYLGAWQFSGPKGPQWLAVLDDLSTRGVERIRFLIGPDPTELQAALEAPDREPMPNCTVLPTADPSLEPALIEALRPGHRSCIERAWEVANALGDHLGRTTARHGRFADLAAAQAFLHRSANRFIDAHWPEPSALPLPTPRQTARHDGMAFSA